jgi:hypothetical protein
MTLQLCDIPQSWLILILLFSLVIMRCFGIDTFATAGISAIIGYVTGKHIEQGNQTNP